MLLAKRAGTYVWTKRVAILLWIFSLLMLIVAASGVAGAYSAQSLIAPNVRDLLRPGQIYLLAAIAFAVAVRLPPAPQFATLVKARHVLVRLNFVALGFALWAFNWQRVFDSPKDPLPLVLWPVSVVLVLLGSANWPSGFSKPLTMLRSLIRPPKPTLAIPVLVFAAALALRLYRLDEIPSFLGDEMGAALFALKIVYQKSIPYFALFDGSPSVQFAIMGFSLASFGESVATLRLPNVILGSMEVLFVYLLGKEIGGRRTGLIAAVLLAALSVHMHFSRTGLTFIAASFAWTGAAAFLARGIRRGSWLEWTLAGVVAGYGVNYYHSARLLPVLLVVFLAGLLILRPRPIRWLLPGALCLALGFMIGVGPIAALFWKSSQQLLSRSSESWLPVAWTAMTDPSALKQPVDVWQLFLSHLRLETLGLSILGDAHSFYRAGLPMLSVTLAPVFFLGVTALTIRLWNWRCLLLGLWLWSSFLVLGTGSNIVPIFSRPSPLFAAASLTAALAISSFGAAWARVFRPPVVQAPYWLMAAVFVALVSAQQYTDYFVKYQPRENWPIWDLIGRYVLSLPANTDIVMVGNLDSQARSPAVQFGALMGKKNAIFDWQGPDKPVEPAAPERSLAFIFHHTRFKELLTVVDLYPGGTEDQLRDSKGGVWWRVYTVRPPP